MRSLVLKYVPTVLGLLFLYSGAYKVVYPGEATYALVALDLPKWLANSTIIAVTALEVYLGLILLLKKDLRFALSATTALMFAFTGFLWYLSTLASPPACGCLGLTGMFNSTKHDALFGIFRNCVILWALKLSYDYYFKKPATP
ncbi:MAG: hypothetical protein L0Z50_02840 [Verrucomicrobiales bacterium]|nr:hypothetical protein [Verrucomicrobiales bacterium]